jgi:hypothetical protein
MSELAFYRFMNRGMLTLEEQEHKDEVVESTEQAMNAKGIECDEGVKALPDEQLAELLEEVRALRNKKKKKKGIVQEEEGEKSPAAVKITAA